jgi:CAAX prenyl protease-like protein
MTKNYVAPFVLYLLGTLFLGMLPEGWYPLGYAVVVVLVGVATWCLLRGQGIVQLHAGLWEGVAIGIIGIFAWIVISDFELERRLAQTLNLPSFLMPARRTAYNPFEELSQTWMVYVFTAFRLVGLAVLVPIVEEIFWRGFLSRWLIVEEWESVPLGKFTWFAFFFGSLLFTTAHPEWFAAFVYAAMINGLFYWKKDLWPCIVAHAVSNFILGVYVLTTASWSLW